MYVSTPCIQRCTLWLLQLYSDAVSPPERVLSSELLWRDLTTDRAQQQRVQTYTAKGTPGQSGIGGLPPGVARASARLAPAAVEGRRAPSRHAEARPPLSLWERRAAQAARSEGRQAIRQAAELGRCLFTACPYHCQGWRKGGLKEGARGAFGLGPGLGLGACGASGHAVRQPCGGSTGPRSQRAR